MIIPDLRGNGNSTVPVTEPSFRNHAEVRDLIALADKLRLSEFDVVGYSRGAIVAAEWITRDRRIRLIVPGGMSIDFTDPEWARRRAFADAFAGKKVTDKTRGAVAYATSIGIDLQSLALQQEFQPAPGQEELRVTSPVLVVRGREDEENGDPLALRALFSNGRMHHVTGDHNGAYRTEEFSDAVVRFLVRE